MSSVPPLREPPISLYLPSTDFVYSLFIPFQISSSRFNLSPTSFPMFLQNYLKPYFQILRTYFNPPVPGHYPLQMHSTNNFLYGQSRSITANCHTKRHFRINVVERPSVECPLNSVPEVIPHWHGQRVIKSNDQVNCADCNGVVLATAVSWLS